MKKFDNDYGVFCCPHVFLGEDVKLVIRDYDGSWQFLCGNDDTSTEPKFIGVGHLTNKDPSINQVTNLNLGQGAERDSIKSGWILFDLDC